MSRFTVGSVPYVNALPLVQMFEEMGEQSPVRVVYDVPSQLPALLESGQVDAIMVSSYEALSRPGMRMAAGLCVGTQGAVESVRLFSKVPPKQIETLALDQSSMTSNRLAQVVLRERYKAQPMTVTLPPDPALMLEKADSCILIGDIGMTASVEGLHVMDLGEEWRAMTKLPFVWAAWIGRDGLTPELSGFLSQAMEWSACGKPPLPTKTLADRLASDAAAHRRMTVVEAAATRPGWSLEIAYHYLNETMTYTLGESELKGLQEFCRRLNAAGFDEARHFPALISPA